MTSAGRNDSRDAAARYAARRNALRQLGVDSRGAQVLVLSILAVATAAMGLWLIVTGIATITQTQSILSGGHLTTARVIAVDASVPNPVGAPDDEQYTTTVQFTTAGGTTVAADLPSGGVQHSLAVGDPVRIAYDVSDTSRIVLDDPAVTASLSSAVWIGALVLVGAAVLGYFDLRILRGRRSPAR